jgi:hypothetical protein
MISADRVVHGGYKKDIEVRHAYAMIVMTGYTGEYQY